MTITSVIQQNSCNLAAFIFVDYSNPIRMSWTKETPKHMYVNKLSSIFLERKNICRGFKTTIWPPLQYSMPPMSHAKED